MKGWSSWATGCSAWSWPRCCCRPFRDEPEGALARRHAELVRKETLASVAGDIELAQHVRLPAIEERAARSNPSLLADVCEAIIAALYVDGGIAVGAGFHHPALDAAHGGLAGAAQGSQDGAAGMGARPGPQAAGLPAGPDRRTAAPAALHRGGRGRGRWPRSRPAVPRNGMPRRRQRHCCCST